MGVTNKSVGICGELNDFGNDTDPNQVATAVGQKMDQIKDSDVQITFGSITSKNISNDKLSTTIIDFNNPILNVIINRINVIRNKTTGKINGKMNGIFG